MNYDYVTTQAIGSSSNRVPLPALAGLNHAGSSGFGSAAAASAGSLHSFGGQVASNSRARSSARVSRVF